MNININKSQVPKMPESFYQVIEQELAQLSTEEHCNAITLNFRDPRYSADRGGFHPVEIRLEKQQEHWRLVYTTDFAFHGQPFPELVKEIDICFNSKQVYSVYSGWLSENEGIELIKLLAVNFHTYYQMGVYKVDVSFG